MTALSDAVESHLRTMVERLDVASGRGRKENRSLVDCRMCTDDFLVGTSQHLGAMVQVLLPAVHRLPDGRRLEQDFLHAAKALERAMVIAKARQYGQAQNVARSWHEVWDKVRAALTEVATVERQLIDKLSGMVSDEELGRLGDRVDAAARRAPTRPHPSLPHRGVAGHVVRSIMGRADRVWDELEGRISHPLGTPEAS